MLNVAVSGFGTEEMLRQFVAQKGLAHVSESGHRLAAEALLEGMFDKTPHVFERCRS